LEKIKYTFDLTLCDNLFDILLENNFIKLFDHKVSPSALELEDKKYCKWHNSFNHNTSDCNIFCQFIQSAIDTGLLRFAQTREDDQLATIGFNGKGSLNRLASAGLSKDLDLIAKEEDSKLPSVENDIVHNLQDQVIFGDDEPIKIPEFTGGQKDFSPSSQEPVTLPVLESQVRPVQPKGQTGDPQVRPVQLKGLIGASVKKSEMFKSGHPEVDGGKDHVKHNDKRSKPLLMNFWLNKKKTMRPSVIIGQIKLNHQDCLLSIILGIRIGKERVFNQQHHIILLSHQCRFHVLHVPLVFIHIHHGGGVIHGHILLHISDHIMLSMQLQGDHHVQGSRMLKVTVLNIKIGLVLKTRKRLSRNFTK
jgi:hypothetical protein